MNYMKNRKDQEQLILLPQTPSTNTYLSDLLKENPHQQAWTVVMTENQTAGRGQQGNSWFSTPGLNLTLSILLRPFSTPVQSQFILSELCALGVLNTLDFFLPQSEDKGKLSIKWPNDIYYGDKKIAGILIEHSLTGQRIDYTILGIGLNINEPDYPDHLPNPISLRMILGRTIDCDIVYNHLLDELHRLYCHIESNTTEVMHDCYMQRLYRRSGLYPYRDKDGVFEASIADILPSGELVLARPDGTRSQYAFKEISYIL